LADSSDGSSDGERLLIGTRRAGHVKGELPESGRKIPAHWVSGHWKNQPHGVGFASISLYGFPFSREAACACALLLK
jgi:hypothetical protein